MKAGIVLDKWKLPVFQKRLTEAGFSFEELGQLTPGTFTLTVETENAAYLQTVIEQCQAECQKQKEQNNVK